MQNWALLSILVAWKACRLAYTSGCSIKNLTWTVLIQSCSTLNCSHPALSSHWTVLIQMNFWTWILRILLNFLWYFCCQSLIQITNPFFLSDCFLSEHCSNCKKTMLEISFIVLLVFLKNSSIDWIWVMVLIALGA